MEKVTGCFRGRCEGAALLVVLGAVLLISIPALAMTRLATSAKQSETLSSRLEVADDLREQAIRTIYAWLASDSYEVVLSVRNRAPSLSMMEESWRVGDLSLAVSIQAYDQCGMIPVGELARGGWSDGVSEDVLQKVRTLKKGAEGRAIVWGLDLFTAGTPRRDPFPGMTAERSLALGDWLATHSTGRVNVNTAPISLLEAVYRKLGRGGLEVVMNAREEGQISSVGAARGERSSSSGIWLAGSSDSWSFRVDVSVGALVRSWWLVFQDLGAWTLVQQLVIPHA